MISHKFTFKEGDLKIDFNWSEEVIPCKEVKISLGDKEVIISREKFSTLMAIFADDQQMEDILQTTKTEFVSIQRMLKLKIKDNIKAGEHIVFPYIYWVPKAEYEKLKEDGEMIKMIDNDKKTLIKYVSENEAAKEIKTMWEKGNLKLEDLRK